MMLPASRSRSPRAFLAAIAFVGVVAIGIAWASTQAVSATASTEAVSPAPDASTPTCHETHPEPVITSSPTDAQPASLVEGATVPPSPSGPNPFANRFEGIVLRTHEGKNVRFYEDLLKGKIVLVNFMYATCKGR